MYDKLFGLPSLSLNQRPWHKKASSDARPGRDFRRKSERRKGRGVARASENIRWMFVPKQQGFSPPDLRGRAPGIKIKPHRNAEPSQKHKTLI